MKSLAVRLAASYLLIAVIALAGAGVLAYHALSEYVAFVEQAALESKLDAAARTMSIRLLYAPSEDIRVIAEEVTRYYPQIRVQGELPSSVPPYPVAGSAASVMHFRAEAGVLTRVLLMTPPDNPNTRLVAVQQNGEPRNAIRLTWVNPEDLRAAFLRRVFAGAGALALTAAVIMAILFSRTLARPLQRMATAAGRLAEGDWEVTLPEGGPREVQALAHAFRAMSQRLRADFERLRGDREQLKRLAAEVAHELKTPIASLRTYHELLLDGEQENPATRPELLARGAAQVRRLEFLANFLVDMARLEAHTAPLELRETDLAELVLQAVGALLPEAQQRAVEIRPLGVDRPVPLLANPHRVGQALDNLLRNALRWSPAGSVITVTLERGESVARVTVADEGPGISPELLPRLFSPFVRDSGSPGLGLGLAIVRAVAQSHGGTVFAANRPEGGAAFTLTFPLKA